MGLIRADRVEVEARIGRPVEAGCGASPLGTVWPCGCFALAVAPHAIDWLPCADHVGSATELEGEHLGDLWQSRLRL